MGSPVQTLVAGGLPSLLHGGSGGREETGTVMM